MTVLSSHLDVSQNLCNTLTKTYSNAFKMIKATILKWYMKQTNLDLPGSTYLVGRIG